MYNHWKKILLALTAFFWNACDNNTTPTGPAVGPDPASSSTEGQNSSSSVVNPGSSSVDNPVSSSSVASSSSTPIAESSSSLDDLPVPLYGIYVGETCTKTEGDSTLVCSDGVTCVESTTDDLEPAETVSPEVSAKYGVIYKPDITAKYGIIYVKDKTYKCSDGKVYNEAEFRARYDVVEVLEKEMPPVLYGPPCVFDGTCGEDK